jgi:hypothetical protein
MQKYCANEEERDKDVQTAGLRSAGVRASFCISFLAFRSSFESQKDFQQILLKTGQEEKEYE